MSAAIGAWPAPITSHMCGDADIFSKFTSTSEKLSLVNGPCAKIEGKGVASTTTCLDGVSTRIDFEDALYVLDLRVNLVLDGKITDRGYNVVFRRDRAEVVRSDGKVSLAAERNDGLYYFKGAPKSANDDEASETCNVANADFEKNSLHDRHVGMGHLNERSLRQAIKMGSVKGIKADAKMDFDCRVCLQGKMGRTPFPKVSERATAPGDIIHSDLSGPMRVASLGRKLYFVTFIDASSGWCELRCIERQDQVSAEFEKFRALVYTQRGRKIKCLQSDNGREYVNKEHNSIFQKNGITRRLTVPYNPQQNGVA